MKRFLYLAAIIFLVHFSYPLVMAEGWTIVTFIGYGMLFVGSALLGGIAKVEE